MLVAAMMMIFVIMMTMVLVAIVTMIGGYYNGDGNGVGGNDVDCDDGDDTNAYHT